MPGRKFASHCSNAFAVIGAQPPRAITGAIAYGWRPSRMTGNGPPPRTNEVTCAYASGSRFRSNPGWRLLAQVAAPGRLEQRAAHQPCLVERAARGAVQRRECHRVDAPGGGERARRRIRPPARTTGCGARHRAGRVAARGIGEVVGRRARRDECGAVAETVRVRRAP